MKKILSLVLVFAMLLGSFSFAFAADTKLTADVEDKAVKKAVERLSAFEIVNGMEDGKYHPELDVTREQFAKLVIEATGLGSAAKAAVGSTKFADVDAARWSAGYINVAAGQGIVKGMPDGTFRPTAKVTYAEAVTMLVRALGYQDGFLEGNWPGNYVAKAAELDITDDVVFATTGYADRGSVAVMVNNTLDAKVIKVNTYEGTLIKYQVSEETLLENKLNIDKAENIRLIATHRLDSSLDDSEIRLLVLKDDVKIDGRLYDEDEEVEIDVVEGINVEGLVGLQITGYFDDDEMIYSEIETPDSNFVRGIAYDDEEDGTVYAWATDKYYEFDKNAKVYVNNEDRTRDIGLKDNKALKLNNVLQSYGSPDFSYTYGNIVLEKGKVTFADLSVFETISGVVQEVNTDKNIIQYIDTFGGTDEEDLNLDDYDEFYVVDVDGNKIELKDVEEDDRFYFYEDAQDDDIAYVMVDQSELVKGDLTEVKQGVSGKDQSRGRIFVDSDGYSLASAWTYSLDKMESFTSADRYLALKDKLEDVFDENVSVYLDLKGRVALLTTEAEATTDNYAVVLRTGSSVKDELKLWTEQDEKVTYEVDDLKNGIKMADIKEKDIIKYDINSDGTIDVLAIVYGTNVVRDGKDEIVITDSNSNDSSKALNQITKTSVKIGDKYYFNQNNSLYFDYSDFSTSGDDDDLDLVVWKDFEDTKPNGVDVVLVTDGDSKDIAFMAFVGGYDNISSDDYMTGYLLKTQEKRDDMVITVVVPGEGEVTYTITDKDTKDDLRNNIERPIVFVERGDGIKIKDASQADNIQPVKGTLVSRSGNDLTVKVDGSNRKYTLSSKSVLYDGDDSIGKYDLEEGDNLFMLLEDGKVAVLGYDYTIDPIEIVTSSAKATVTDAVYGEYTVEIEVENADEVNAAKVKVSKDGTGVTADKVTTDLEDGVATVKVTLGAGQEVTEKLEITFEEGAFENLYYKSEEAVIKVLKSEIE
jgi:hypothetical protein